MNTVKSGLLTTEFWATLLVNLGLVAAAISGNLPPKWAAVASAVSAAAYSISRGLTKAGAGSGGGA